MARQEGINPRKSPTQERSRFTVEQILQAAMGGCGERGAFLGNREGSALTFPIMVVFDEFTRQLQEGGISLSSDL